MFIDEWFADQFYKKLELGYHTRFSFGQFFWTHSYYPHENLELWRPVPDPDEKTKTTATTFRIEAAGQDAFRRGLPLATPKLETNEEFLVVRAKWRPVILIVPEIPLPDVDNRGFRGKVHRRRCLVAQIFGLADSKTRQAQFSPSFVDRVRRMEFPQFMFLPERAGLLGVDSLLRLDELQSVFSPHLQATHYSLGDEAVQVLKGQLALLIAGVGPNEYTELRELMLSS
jgi:hypothetical protein